jgi:cytochrome c
VGHSGPTGAYVASRAGFVTCFEPSIRAATKAVRNCENVLKELKYLPNGHLYPWSGTIAKSRSSRRLASQWGPARDGEIREDNVKLLSFSLAGAGLLASMGVAMAQDAAAGEKVFAKCKICHQIGEGAKNMVGPVLNGVVGRKAGSYPDYHYSDANKNSGITWDEATLKEYLRDPKAKVPGTKMVFPGLKSDDDIANVIAYLKQFGPDGKKI